MIGTIAFIDRAGARVVPARRVRRDGAEEPVVLGARPRRAACSRRRWSCVATVFRPIIVALNATANGVAAPVPRRAEERGEQRLHPRRGRDDRGPVDHARACSPTRTGALSAAFEFTDEEGARMSRSAWRSWSRLPEDATPAEVERAVAQHGFSRYVLVDDDGRADRLPAPQGRASTSTRRRVRRAGAAEAHPPADLDLPRAPTSRTRWRPCAAPARHLARVFDETGATHGRAVPRGHHRGARRRGAGRHPRATDRDAARAAGELS